jgi:CRP-like cAMP-binding protein
MAANEKSGGSEQLEKWVDLLLTLEFFENFEREDLKALFKFGEVKMFRAKEYIIKENVLDSSFYFLLNGRAEVNKLDPSRNTVGKIANLETGDCFGEMAVWLSGLRTASVMALKDCAVFGLNRDDLERMDLPLQCKMVKRLAYSMASKIKENNEKLVKFM